MRVVHAAPVLKPVLSMRRLRPGRTLSYHILSRPHYLKSLYRLRAGLGVERNTMGITYEPSDLSVRDRVPTLYIPRVG